MIQVRVSAGQSLIDVCLQALGSTAPLSELADLNGLTITSELQPGQLLTIPEASQLAAPEVASYYATRQLRINTHNVALVPALPQTGHYFSPLYFNPQFFS